MRLTPPPLRRPAALFARPHPGCYLLGWVVCWLLLPTAAAQPTTFISQTWTTEDGLPQNSVTHLAQTPDGYLWLSTFGGLARFDGLRFTTYDRSTHPALPSNRLTTLFLDRHGRLWIGSEGDEAIRWDGTDFQTFPLRGDPTSSYIHSFFEDADGHLWAALRDGEHFLARLQDSTFTVLPEARYPRDALGSIGQARQDADGSTWLPLRTGLARLRGGQVTRHLLPEARYGDDYLAITALAGDTLLLADSGGRRFRYHDGTFVAAPPLATTSTRLAFFYDDQQQVWIADEDGVLRQTPEALHRAYHWPENTSRQVLSFLKDREGNYWFGTDGQGLIRLTAALFEVYSTDAGLSTPVTLSLTQSPDGAVWVGTNCGGLNRLLNGRFSQVAASVLPAHHCVYAVFADQQGTVWAGSEALVRVTPNGLQRYDERHGLRVTESIGDFVRVIYEDPHAPGTLWVGTLAGLYRFADERFTDYFGVEDGLTGNQIRAVLRSRDGALWVSTNDGLSRLQAGTLTPFSTATGFPSNDIRALYEDPEGTLWVGTYGDGLIRLKDEEGTVIRRADGLFDNVVSSLLEDDVGRLWMSGNRGIYWAERASLNAFAEGRAERVRSVGYRHAAGLRNPETNGGFQPSALRSTDGRLWFPTLDGVAAVDPTKVAQAATPPPVHIEQLTAQNEALPLAAPVRLQPDQRSFEITYTGIRLAAPALLRFRYRLAQTGNEPWTEASNRRTAFYTNVAPGRYTFEVQAFGQGAEAAAATATLPLVVVPRFYERGWVQALFLAALVLALAYAVLARFRHLRRREQQLDALVRARTQALEKEKRETEEQRQIAEDALRTVGEQAKELQQLSETRSRFFANISHEFRTPLTLIAGPMERHLQAAESEQAALPTETLALVHRNAQRLLRLVNQLLDLSKLEVGALPFRPQQHDLVAFARRCLSAFAFVSEHQQLDLQFEATPDTLLLMFDAEQVEKILANLLSNAIKFTPPGGQVTLRLTATETGARIEVEDTGIGIPADSLPYVFDRFYQADSTSTRRFEGTGIGLAYTQELVHLHGGAIEVASTLGAGTCFTVYLPRHPALAAATPPVPTQAPLPTPVPAPADPAATPDAPTAPDTTTLLVVEDNADMRAYLRSLFAASYRILDAADGAAGLRKARTHLPDLVISDVMMPEMNGFQLNTALKHDPATASIPVILLTARTDATDEVHGLETGADAYVRKPFSADVLHAQVQNLLTQRQRLRAQYQAQPAPAEPTEPADAPASPFLQEVRTCIEAHFADPDFSVEELAETMSISRPTLYRKLRSETGQTPVAAIREARLLRARADLAAGVGNISEVAYGVGFNSLSYFSKLFREEFGMTPSDFLASVSEPPI